LPCSPAVMGFGSSRGAWRIASIDEHVAQEEFGDEDAFCRN
jgi:hypothetical protein